MLLVAYTLSFLCLILNAPVFLCLRAPYSFFFVWFPQLLSGALSPFLVALGVLGAGLGWLSHAPIAVAAGLPGAGISAIYIALVTVPQLGFALAFGEDWQRKVPYPLTNHAFDLLLPQVSPPSQAALYYLERCLALMV